MYTFLLVLFIILCFFLAIFVLIQQGKGDLGLGSMGGTQMLFGGSGGQGFFEKATWIMGALFIFGALGLSILRSKEERASILEGASLIKTETPKKNEVVQMNAKDVEQYIKKTDTTTTAQDATVQTNSAEQSTTQSS